MVGRKIGKFRDEGRVTRVVRRFLLLSHDSGNAQLSWNPCFRW